MLRKLSLSCLALLPLVAACGLLPEADASFRRDVPVGAQVELTVESASGKVTVQAGADGKVSVSGLVRAWDVDEQQARTAADQVAAQPPVTATDGGVRLAQPDEGDAQIDYVVEVPAAASAVIHTASGDVCVKGLGGRLEINTASGQVGVRQAGGAVKIRTASGDASVTGAASADIGTASGDVSADQIAGDLKVSTAAGARGLGTVAGDVDADTASGDIALTSALGKDRTWKLRSTSGDLALALPADAQFAIDASSVSGRITTQFALNAVDGPGTHVHGALGASPAGRLDLSTTSGDIDVRLTK
jgi:hypothetical protein